VTIPVDTGTDAGALVDRAGQVQFGPMLLGGGTSAGWRKLTGWRDLPGLDVADTPRPQADGAYPGSVYAQSVTVTYDFLLRGLPDAKLVDLGLLERHTRPGVGEVPLVVDDGAGPTMRMARVVQRTIPMEQHYRHAPLDCSVQFVCADPRRYSVALQTVTLAWGASSGGLAYPLDYPLQYGTDSGGSRAVQNAGTVDTPLVATLTGPLTNPVLSCAAAGWSMAFDLNVAAGEQLTIDTNAGTVLLGGADRLYTLTSASSPVDACLLPPGEASLSLSAPSGTGTASVTYRHAYL
jgi:hypothetical protein